jgi:LacI family transcriptional regulator
MARAQAIRAGGRGRVGIQQVAEAAGVSTATASRVLSRTGYTSEQARRLVSQAAARLNYQPDAMARGLRRRTSTTIGILVPDLTNPVTLSFIRGVQHVAQPCGYAVTIGDAQRARDIERRQVELFRSQRVAGVLVADAMQDPDALTALEADTPVIHTPATLEAEGESEDAAIGELVEDLARRGHRRILFVSRSPVTDLRPGLPRTERRFGSLSLAAAQRGMEVDRCTTPAGLSAGQTASQLEPWLGKDGSDHALLCASHRLAPQLLGTLSLMQMAIPQDLSFVTFGDSEWAQAYRPAIAVIRFDRYAEARRATHDLLVTLGDAPEHEEPPGSPVYLARGSVGSCPTVGR